MERQRFLPLLAVIIFIWVLWRYEAALACSASSAI